MTGSWVRKQHHTARQPAPPDAEFPGKADDAEGLGKRREAAKKPLAPWLKSL